MASAYNEGRRESSKAFRDMVLDMPDAYGLFDIREGGESPAQEGSFLEALPEINAILTHNVVQEEDQDGAVERLLQGIC